MRLLPLWLAACLTAAGCGGTRLLREPQPLLAHPPIATASDSRVEASIEAIIVRNGPGSWAKDASWDEYLITVRNKSADPVTLTGVAVWDSSGTRSAPGKERSDLVEASRATERRFREKGLTVVAGSGSPWAVAAGIGTATVVAAGAMGSAAAASASGTMVAGAAAGAVAAGVLVVGGGALAGYAIHRAVHNSRVNGEIQRRHTPMPAVVPGAGQVRLDLFFPYAPSPSRVEVTYETASGTQQLLLDTAATLKGLHLGDAPGAIAAPSPRPAPGTPLQHALAETLATGKGSITYWYRAGSSPGVQEVRLVGLGPMGGMQSSSDPSGELAFEPPIPLAVTAMRVGHKWSHSGTATRREAIGMQVRSDFVVAGMEDIDVPAGRLVAFRVEERRTIHETDYRLTHWVDAASLVLVSTRASRLRRGSAPELDYTLEIASVR